MVGIKYVFHPDWNPQVIGFAASKAEALQMIRKRFSITQGEPNDISGFFTWQGRRFYLEEEMNPFEIWY